MIRGELGQLVLDLRRDEPSAGGQRPGPGAARRLAGGAHEYIEERTIGPSLGAENIEKGFNSVKFGLLAIAVFMIVYYPCSASSTLALVVNLLLLIAILSVMQATLTLPGIAAIAFTLGMAIDANVLVNERIREELRNGARPDRHQRGLANAWATILDSNVTTLIAGIALLVFGSGPIRASPWCTAWASSLRCSRRCCSRAAWSTSGTADAASWRRVGGGPSVAPQADR